MTNQEKQFVKDLETVNKVSGKFRKGEPSKFKGKQHTLKTKKKIGLISKQNPQPKDKTTGRFQTRN